MGDSAQTVKSYSVIWCDFIDVYTLMGTITYSSKDHRQSEPADRLIPELRQEDPVQDLDRLE